MINVLFTNPNKRYAPEQGRITAKGSIFGLPADIYTFSNTLRFFGLVQPIVEVGGKGRCDECNT